MTETSTQFTTKQKTKAWLVHLFTASGAVLGLLALWAIHEGHFIGAFWLLAATIIIDSVDGWLARRTQAKMVAPQIDGALLDNIVDYFTYVLVPAFFLLVADMLPFGWAFLAVSTLALASAYQFTQPEAKTDDHFFKGFPSYWNIVVFYLFFWQFSPWTNLFIIFLFSLLVFVPIKYVYPSRLEYLTPNRWLRIVVVVATLLWGAATAGMLFVYPESSPIFAAISIAYCIFYILISVYRTFVPVKPVPSEAQQPG
jgi:phosphatidylcholine synthase